MSATASTSDEFKGVRGDVVGVAVVVVAVVVVPAAVAEHRSSRLARGDSSIRIGRAPAEIYPRYARDIAGDIARDIIRDLHYRVERLELAINRDHVTELAQPPRARRGNKHLAWQLSAGDIHCGDSAIYLAIYSASPFVICRSARARVAAAGPSVQAADKVLARVESASKM